LQEAQLFILGDEGEIQNMHRCDSIGRPVVLDGLARGGVQEIEEVSAGATESARQHTEEPQSHTLQLRECGSITYERLEILLQRLDESARHSDDAVHFLRRRAEIEEVYAKSLRRLYEESGEAKLVSFRAIKNKLTRAPADSAGLLTQTSWRAWSAVTCQTLQASQLHQALAERLSKGAATQLAKVTLAAQTRRKEVEKLATGLAKDLRDANRALERADQLASIAHKHAVPASPPAGNRGPPLGSVMFGAFFKKQAATSEEAERVQSGARKR
jgi:hypothetical protein